jgi:peptide chain release factor 2
MAEPRAATERSTLRAWLRLRGSRPVVGSSKKSSSGALRTDAAMSIRRRMPPEQCLTCFPAGDGGGRARSVATAVRLEGVAVVDVSEELKSLSSTMESIEAVLDLDKLRADIAVLEEQAAAPSLWDNPDEAQKITSKLSHLQAEVRKADTLRGRIDDLAVLFEMAQEEDDPDTLAEAEAELTSVKKALDEMEVRTLLSGEYDSREALVNIRAEAGGVDAADFAEKLQRMYLRWAEQHGYKTEIYETSYAEEAGIKSTTFAVQIPYAYGTLSVEQGTHRLVRISPFDNQGRRQTSFAGVEILPVVEQTDHIEIDESELRVDVYRSSGPGGQGVNTTDSAVRLTHLPTGIVVSCQNERSQIQNKASAMNVLQAKLLERRRQEEQAAMDALKGDGGNSWGNQMRSYVLHPYQMVKDLRTDFEVGNPEAVFNGEIDGFLEAGIRWRKQQEK